MALKNLHKAPFPWFGGKSDAAPIVWQALGDVHHYVEPFAGSLAVLLRRPHPANRAYFSETVNDLDGLLVNAWRAIAHDPEAVADAVSWPVSEADMHARHLAIVNWRAQRQLEHLMGDPDFFDAKMAGYWIYGQSAWIGGEWGSGKGPWIVGVDGRIQKRTAASEPGVIRQKPHLSDSGNGIHRPGVREPGVIRKKLHLSDSGNGIHHPGIREPGVSRQKPHLSGNGRGVHHPGIREPGVSSESEDFVTGDTEFHPMTMPETLRWMQFLSARLRHVRILHGDWKRIVTPSSIKTLSVRAKNHFAGIFLDPPYSHTVRDKALYAQESATAAEEVRAWCLQHGNDPKIRVVLAGFAGEHDDLERHGWRAVEWFRTGFLKGGYSNRSKDGTKQTRERLWLSPHCGSLEAQ